MYLSIHSLQSLSHILVHLILSIMLPSSFTTLTSQRKKTRFWRGKRHAEGRTTSSSKSQSSLRSQQPHSRCSSPPPSFPNLPASNPSSPPLLSQPPAEANAIQCVDKRWGKCRAPTWLMSLSSSSCSIRSLLALCRRFSALSLASSSRSSSFLFFIQIMSFCFMTFLRVITASYRRPSASVWDGSLCCAGH